MNFDPKCLELAEYFFPDAPLAAQRALAGQLQQTVEDFAPAPCRREDGHDGPCNGFPRRACAALQVAERIQEEQDGLR